MVEVSTESEWSAPCSTVAPRCASTSDMISMSEMRGTLWSTVFPRPRIDAAMSFNAEFFAPEMRTSPFSTPLPSTMISSAIEQHLLSWRAGELPKASCPRDIRELCSHHYKKRRPAHGEPSQVKRLVVGRCGKPRAFKRKRQRADYSPSMKRLKPVILMVPPRFLATSLASRPKCWKSAEVGSMPSTSNVTRTPILPPPWM